MWYAEWHRNKPHRIIEKTYIQPVYKKFVHKEIHTGSCHTKIFHVVFNIILIDLSGCRYVLKV